MDIGLAGKRALVTGSSSGLGAEIARMLAAEGVRVIVHGRNRERAEAVAREIDAAGVALGDLKTDRAAEEIERTVRDALGGIDILVNNSGGSEGGGASDWLASDEKQWAITHEANAIAAMRMVRRFVPDMRQAGWGRVIQIASAAGVLPQPVGIAYGAAKAAMINMGVGLSKALGGTGVTVNTVSPGTILTPAVERHVRTMFDKLGWGEMPLDEAEARLVREHYRTPAGRFGRPADIAHAVLMLCAANGGYITGANIRVDGGMVPTVN